MTTEPRPPTDQTALPGKILDWLNDQGFPLEMQVASLLTRSGLTVFQSDFYKDPDEDKWREIDVVAHLTRRNELGSGFARVEYVIECKHQSKPWVLFGRGRPIAGAARVAQRITNPRARSRLYALASRKDIQSQPLFALRKERAYGMTVVTFRDDSGVDVPYAAAMTVVKAAVSLAKRMDVDKVSRFFLALPVIVTDAPLFMCALNTSGELTLRRIQVADLLWRHGVSGHPYSIIRIVHRDALEAWSLSATQDAAAILPLLDPDGVAT